MLTNFFVINQIKQFMGKNKKEKSNNDFNRLLATVSSDLTMETINYKGITLQRLTKDALWYAVFNGKIINWSQYRNDLKSWIDSNCV